MSHQKDVIGQYLEKIGRFALLNRHQELELAHQVADWVKLKQLRTEAANRSPSTISHHLAPLKERWATLAGLDVPSLEKRLAAVRQAKQKLIEANLRLVVAIAKKYHRAGIDLFDLIQEGNLALDKAVEKFDPTLGYKLSTFAYWQIRKTITHALPDLLPGACRLPNSVLRNLRQLPQIRQQLAQEKGRAPTYQELASALGIAPLKLRILLEHWTKSPLSLDYVPKNLNEGSLENVIPDFQALREQEKWLAVEEVKTLFAIAQLTDQEANVLRLRYGLNEAQKNYSWTSIEQLLQLSRYQVRHLEQSAFQKLRSISYKLRPEVRRF